MILPSSAHMNWQSCLISHIPALMVCCAFHNILNLKFPFHLYNAGIKTLFATVSGFKMCFFYSSIKY